MSCVALTSFLSEFCFLERPSNRTKKLTCHRVRATVLEVKLQIGLGILSVPSVLHTLGFVPGILVLVLIAIMTGCESSQVLTKTSLTNVGSNYVVGRTYSASS